MLCIDMVSPLKTISSGMTGLKPGLKSCMCHHNRTAIIILPVLFNILALQYVAQCGLILLYQNVHSSMRFSASTEVLIKSLKFITYQ